MWMVGLSKTGNISEYDTQDINDSIRELSKGIDKVAREGGRARQKIQGVDISSLVIALVSLGITLIF